MMNFMKRPKTRNLFIVLVILFVIITIILVFLSKNSYKTSNIGNNNSNKTLEKVEEYILNINSFKAIVEVTINSNKNTNKYILKQVHKENEDIQEVLEPKNIEGVRLTYKDSTLKVENTKLNLEKFFNNYEYIESNNLWLNTFINEYKVAKEKNILENDEKISMKVKIEDENKINYKILYLNKKTLNPTKLLVMDNNENEIIYILYNEIELNS